MNLDTDAFVLPLILHIEPVANDPLHPAAVRSTPALWSFTGFMQFLKISIYAHLLLNKSNLDTRLSLGSNFDLRSIIKFAWAKPQEMLSRVVTHISSYMLHDFMNQLVEKNSCAPTPTPQLSMLQPTLPVSWTRSAKHRCNGAWAFWRLGAGNAVRSFTAIPWRWLVNVQVSHSG